MARFAREDWKKNNPTPSAKIVLPNFEPRWLHITRRIAGWLSSAGFLLLLVLAIGWVWGLVNVFSGGAVFGYFRGEPIALLALFLTCVFYMVFLLVQSLVGLLLRFARKRPASPNMWPKLATFALWVIAAIGVYGIVNQSIVIQTGLQVMGKDVQLGGFGR